MLVTQRRERATHYEQIYQQRVIQAKAAVTRTAHQAMGANSVSSTQVYVESAQEIWAIKNSVQDPTLRPLTDRVCEDNVKMNGVYLGEATAAGNNLLLAEVERPIYEERLGPGLRERVRRCIQGERDER